MAKKAAVSTRAERGKGPTLIQQSRRIPDEQKALYHQVLGAGRSRVKRPFLGLTQNDIDTIRQRVSDGVAKSVKDSGRS